MRRILFVDDHPIYREGLRRAIVNIASDIDIVDVEGVSQALDRLGADPDFDLCLVDKKLGDGDGLSLAREIRARHPAVAVGVLCAEPHAELANDIRRIGGIACLAKTRDAPSIVGAIDAMFRGELVFDEVESASATSPREISKRRSEVMRLASEGLLDKQISDRLGISESTVRHHWNQIFKLLDSSNRSEAVVKALKRGLI